MPVRALLVWCGLACAAILDAGVREAWLAPVLGDRGARQLSTLILCAAILLLARGTIGWIRPDRLRETLLIGGSWLVLTLAFEFLAGHFLFGASWSDLFADYDLAQGRIWFLVLLTTTLAPLLTASGWPPPKLRSALPGSWPRPSRPGEVNYGLLDRFTIVHFGIGVGYGLLGVDGATATALGAAWELVENPLKAGLPRLFPHATRDTLRNAFGDIVAVSAGCVIVRLISRA